MTTEIKLLPLDQKLSTYYTRLFEEGRKIDSRPWPSVEDLTKKLLEIDQNIKRLSQLSSDSQSFEKNIANIKTLRREWMWRIEWSKMGYTCRVPCIEFRSMCLLWFYGLTHMFSGSK